MESILSYPCAYCILLLLNNVLYPELTDKIMSKQHILKITMTKAD